MGVKYYKDCGVFTDEGISRKTGFEKQYPAEYENLKGKPLK